YFPAEVDSVYFPQVEVVGDIGSSLTRLTELVAPNPYWDFNYFERVQESVKNQVHESDSDDRFPVIPQRFVSDVRKALPEDGIVTLDNGIYKVWFARNYPVRQPNTLLLDNALATMGAGLPSAIAAKIIHPERQVLSVCGDGGFMMNSQELETAIRLKLDLVVLVLRDNAYGMIKWKQAGMNLPEWGLDYGNPDFVEYARSYGAQGVRVESAGDLVPTLRRSFQEGGVWLVELPVDYSENAKVLISELREKVCLV
ncbi:MAG: acetolactate synthase large subunit, partial [Verrucomicrobiae bacterium]|nr:acetolactate synthase large subunit [Verrucomicrobiae bacterium]